MTREGATGAPATQRGPVRDAYDLLHIGFTVAPIVAGLDKFFHLLVDWDVYLSPLVSNVIPAHVFMSIVGVIEVIAGVLVWVRPRVGGYVVAAWLTAVIGNLVLGGGHLDVALRDVGLVLGAIALARLAMVVGRESGR